MKIIKLIYIGLITLTIYSLNAQELDYQLNILDLNQSPTHVKIISNPKVIGDNVYLTGYNNGFSDLFVFDGVNVKALLQNQAGIQLADIFKDGLFIYIGNGFDEKETYYLNNLNQELTLLPIPVGKPRGVYPSEDKVFILSRTGDLYISDGTVEGTNLVQTYLNATRIRETTYNGKLIYESNFKLWMHDGTPEGAKVISDREPGASNQDSYLEINNLLYYIAFENGFKPWITDGTPEGTKNLIPNFSINELSDIYQSEDRLVFVAAEINGNREFWTSDGTIAGTKIIKEIAPGSAAGLKRETSFIERPFFKGYLFAQGGENNSHQLWISNGTVDGTKAILDFSSTINYNEDWKVMTYFSNQEGLFFLVTNHIIGERTVWVFDSMTQQIKSIITLPENPTNTGIANYSSGSKVYFLIENQIWVSDGTTAGSKPIGNYGSSFKFLHTVNDLFYYTDYQSGENSIGEEPFVSNGVQDY